MTVFCFIALITVQFDMLILYLFLPVLRRKSAYMAKHLHVLRSYIQAGKVSIYSTALPGFDDVSGFGGVQLNDAYAEQYFVNMCLYYAKGMYNYVSIGHVEEYIIPDKASHGAEDGSSFVHTVLKELVSSAGVTNNTVSTASRGNNKISGGTQYAPCTYALSSPTHISPTQTTTLLHTTNLRGSIGGKSNTTSSSRSVVKYTVGKVSGKLDVYGIEDPVGSFGNWGPGESAWGRGKMLYYFVVVYCQTLVFYYVSKSCCCWVSALKLPSPHMT